MADTPKSKPSKAQAPVLTTASDTNATHATPGTHDTHDTHDTTVRRLAAKLQAQQVAHQAQVAVLTRKLEECRERYIRQGALLSNQIATILERIDAIRRSLPPSPSGRI